ncbi:rod shape-determining protein MreC [Anaplasma phagocytophilum]|uniref:Cell shape-determining protein MreC n=3 Tax=Anaplasma phagocytophilum TaxID=948 RepID=A0A0F3NBZ3_ANAPH|nr:rod shape-determining protein MreC [Anaplasma phagocytophilum]KJZ99156.1 rod shape-determining MreC family protein [Anaplasma phagocytophilum str. CR1007]AGR79398.1 hypothetical protein YYU_02925 [Anaplasma phagocytophilum str. HZ2]AGR80644.1 hypothetical protein WSQ_02920 [Anaplasma phagocytophilum str. JM]AGR81901.1 hypothetical protein YYY_02930 [Anaplasma phagocytophilum str. Dog2]EOA60942.1 rod shape-determining protein MreC [Anaplasma phagocytophilum str. HGE1]
MVRYVRIKPTSGVSYYLKRGFFKIMQHRVCVLVIAGSLLYCFGRWFSGDESSFFWRMRTHVVDRCVAATEVVMKSAVPASLCAQSCTAIQDAMGVASCFVRTEMLAEENENFRRLLNFVSDYRGLSYITTRVIHSYDGISRKVFLPLGTRDGIKNQQAVVNSKGLVGKIVDVSERSSRVLLVTDKGFDAQVFIVENGVSALLSGSGTGAVFTNVSSSDKEIKIGSIVITVAGIGGFPYGIYVGDVLKSNRVAAAVNVEELDIVSVISLRDDNT